VKRQPPVDQATWDRASAATAGALPSAAIGVALELLQQHELLLTPARRQQIQLELLGYLKEQLDVFRPAEFLRIVVKDGTPGSPAQMLQAIQAFLDMVVEKVKEEGS
jgi:hypothetical protein